MVALRAKSDKIILGGMGMTNDDYLFFKNTFSNAGALDRIISFINTTEDPSVERLLIPDMALTAAEYFSVEKKEKVLVLLTDMTNYADALAIVSNRMDQIPSKDSMPGSLYSDLAKIYEKAVQFPDGGSITIIAVTTLSGGDITHAVPDNTGYITEVSSTCVVTPMWVRSSLTPSARSLDSSSLSSGRRHVRITHR